MTKPNIHQTQSRKSSSILDLQTSRGLKHRETRMQGNQKSFVRTLKHKGSQAQNSASCLYQDSFRIGQHRKSCLLFKKVEVQGHPLFKLSCTLRLLLQQMKQSLIYLGSNTPPKGCHSSPFYIFPIRPHSAACVDQVLKQPQDVFINYVQIWQREPDKVTNDFPLLLLFQNNSILNRNPNA